MPAGSDPSDFRRSAYLLLTAVAVAIALAKVVGAENVIEPSRYKAPGSGGYGSEPKREWPTERPDPTPMFGSNDKSRWATVRALVDDGTHVIGRRHYPDGANPKVYTDDGIIFAGGRLQTIDVVLRPLDSADAGKPVTKEFYSSKPPLFVTILAGEYWLLKKLFGWSIVTDRWLVIPVILVTVNVIPFAVYLVLLARLIEATGKTDFGKLLAFATACFGTFLLTFSGTLNNHLPGAFCVLFAAYPLLRAMAEGKEVSQRGFACSGFFAGLAVTFELPATAFLAGLAAPPLLARRWKGAACFVVAALVPIAALLLTNYLAFREVVPAYAKFGGPWYEYEGSHWARLKLPVSHPDRRGIDFAAEPKDLYAFHLLFGHHGWLSLTPVWFVAAVGLVTAAIRSAADVKKLVRGSGPPWTPPLFAAMSLAVSVVVIGFYVYKTNNYAGNASGPRWLFWLTPLWILAIPPAADRLAGSRGGRLLAAVLLGASVLSVFYPAWNPWRPPWVLQWLEFNNWLRY